MPRPGISKPTSEPPRKRAKSGLPISMPGVWQSPQPMILAKYSPRGMGFAAAAFSAAFAATELPSTAPASAATIAKRFMSMSSPK